MSTQITTLKVQSRTLIVRLTVRGVPSAAAGALLYTANIILLSAERNVAGSARAFTGGRSRRLRAKYRELERPLGVRFQGEEKLGSGDPLHRVTHYRRGILLLAASG